MSKYASLSDYLNGLRVDTWDANFSEVENILGGKLPKSAFSYPAWWSNNPEGHSHSRAWIECGWATESVNLSEKTVTFKRSSSAGDLTKFGSPFGMLKGTITVLFDHDLASPTSANWDEVDA